MKLLTSLLMFICSSFLDYSASAKTLRVAIIDTGAPVKRVKPCSEGHKNFTAESIEDTNGHGTNVAYAIDRYAETSDYCQIYIKYYTPGAISRNFNPFLQSLSYVVELKVDIIVIAGGGNGFFFKEYDIIKKALDQGVIIVAAAGNERSDLDKECNYYPACYSDKIIKVGCQDADKKLCNSSNYAKNVKNFIYENGYKLTAGGVTLTGTSQATAVAAGKLLKYLSIKEKK